MSDELEQFLPEAGGVAWCELHGTKTVDGVAHDVKINLTSRGFTPQEALQKLLSAMKVASEEYKLTPYIPSAKPPEVIPTSTFVVAPEPPEPIYENVKPEGGVVKAIKMTVTPRADGKAKLDFFENGHQYPDVSCVMAPGNLVKMLENVGAWTEEHFKVAKNYDIAYNVEWVFSERTNQYGKPYKNVVKVSR